MNKLLVTSDTYAFEGGGSYYRRGDRMFVKSKTTELPKGFAPDLTAGINICKEEDYFYFDVKIVGWVKTIDEWEKVE